MGAQGTAIVDFGPFPGQSDAIITVSAPGILAGSLVEAWIEPTSTSTVNGTHSPDEHMIETLGVWADQSSIVPNVSFNVHMFNKSQLDEGLTTEGSPGSQIGGIGTRIYGPWQVGWVWN
jgi:hypothetical protein